MTARIVVVLAVTLVGCSGKKVTEIVVDVATDLEIPAAINRINLQVHYPQPGIVTGRIEELVADKQIDVNWDLESAIAGVPPVQLPATIGLLAGEDLSRRVLISVLGMKEKKEVVRRQALLTFAPERIIVVHMNLLKRCASPVSCGDRATCGENGCQELELDSSKQPDFSPEEVAKHFLDSRVVDQRRDTPAADRRVDVRGDGIKTDTKGDAAKGDAAKGDAAKGDAAKGDAAKIDAPKVDTKLLDSKPSDAATACSEWTPLSSGTTANLYGVWGSSDTDVWVVGGPLGLTEKCTMLHYNGSTATWTSTSAVVTKCLAQLNAISGSGSNDVHAVGDYRTGMPAGIEAWHFDGTKWQSMPAGNMGNFRGVWAAPTGGDAFAARGYYMGSPSIFKYTTATGAWNTDGTSPISSFAAVWGTSSSNVFIAGNAYGTGNADVRVSSAGWLSIPPATTKTLRAIWGLSGDVFVVGDSGTIWRNHTITVWYDESISGGPTLRGVSGRGGANQRIFAVGDNTSIYERPKSSTPWKLVCTNPTGPKLNAIWCNPNPISNCCTAVGDGGLVLQRCLL